MVESVDISLIISSWYKKIPPGTGAWFKAMKGRFPMKAVLLAGLDRGSIRVPGPLVPGVGLGLAGVLTPTTLYLTLLALMTSIASLMSMNYDFIDAV